MARSHLDPVFHGWHGTALVERVAGIAEQDPDASGGSRLTGARAGTLTLLRHGESEWNRAGRFTGWADVELTPAGETEAARAGRMLHAAGHVFDRCFTSALRRAIRTSEIVLQTMERPDVAVEQSWRLNERHYGALQGLGPWGAVRRFGLLPVLRSRGTYGYRPPDAERDADDRSAVRPGEAATGAARPRAESLADLHDRLVPFWQDRLAPELARGQSVLVVSHKHTLRALVGVLTGRVGRTSLRVPTGVPIVFTLDRTLAVTDQRMLQDPASRC